jgi:hypothetical protein
MEFEAFPNTIKKKKEKYNIFFKIKSKEKNKSKGENHLKMEVKDGTAIAKYAKQFQSARTSQD